ncbi:MAG: amidohydrolase [bacterium]
MRTPFLLGLGSLLLTASPLRAQRTDAIRAEIDRNSAAIAAKVTAWRHDIHSHPELSFQEARTAKLVADHLKSLGLEVQTDVGGNGVIAILRGGKPGPVVALRADMDALPVVEQVNVPFKSAVRTTYNGQDVGVMHACGHDMHVAMLMGAAEVLTAMRADIPGTVKFLFQPAEESPPTGGAGPMILAGAMDNPKVDAVFGLHVGPGVLGHVSTNVGPITASADSWKVIVHGRQTHGAFPANGVDPIVVGAQIVLAFQTIISRQVDLTTAPAVLTVGAFNGGVRENIIPDSVVMIGTLRTYDAAMRTAIQERMVRTAEGIAKSAGATAEVKVVNGYDITKNDTLLTERMMPTLKRVAGAANFSIGRPSAAGEDFSRFAERAPGMFFNLAVTPPGVDSRGAVNHSPLFQGDDAALPIGVRLMSNVALDFLQSRQLP